MYKKTKKMSSNKHKQKGGYYIRMSKKMRDEMAIPSKTFACTGKDCALCSLYFLGINQETFEKLAKKFVKGGQIGIMFNDAKKILNQYEDYVEKNEPERIKEGKTQKTRIEEINIGGKKITNNNLKELFDMNNGFIKILGYDFFGQNYGHFLIIGKSKNGNLILLDTQTTPKGDGSGFNEPLFISGKKNIIKFFNNIKIGKFYNYIGGLVLRSDNQSRFRPPGHSPMKTPKSLVSLVKKISLNSNTPISSPKKSKKKNKQKIPPRPTPRPIPPRPIPRPNPPTPRPNPPTPPKKRITPDKSNNSGIGSIENSVIEAEELRELYSQEVMKFPAWVLSLYKKPGWNLICNKIENPIPNIDDSKKEEYRNLLLKRQTCNIGMKSYDTRDIKSEYENLWLKSLGLTDEEIELWPNKPISPSNKKKFSDGKLPQNVMVLTYTPMTQKRWDSKKKMVNIMNLVGYAFDSILQPDFQRYYFSNLNIEEGRQILLEGETGPKYISKIKSKEGSLSWDITPRIPSKKIGNFVKGQFGYELIIKYLIMFKSACNLAISNDMEAIFFSGVGANSFGPKGISEQQFNTLVRDIVFDSILKEKKETINGGNYKFKGIYVNRQGKKIMVFDSFRVDNHANTEKLPKQIPEPNYYLKGNEELIFQNDDIVKQTLLRKYPDLKDIINNLKANKVCYVNAWDPHSIAGNGNRGDNSLDGKIGANSAISLLCWPPTNPMLASKVGYLEETDGDNNTVNNAVNNAGNNAGNNVTVIPEPFSIGTFFVDSEIEGDLKTSKSLENFDLLLTETTNERAGPSTYKIDEFEKINNTKYTVLRSNYLSRIYIPYNQNLNYIKEFKILTNNDEVKESTVDNMLLEKGIDYNNPDNKKFIETYENKIGNIIKNMFFNYKGLNILHINFNYEINKNYTNKTEEIDDLIRYLDILVKRIVKLNPDIINGNFNTIENFDKNHQGIKKILEYYKTNGITDERKISQVLISPINKLKAAGYTYAVPKNASSFRNRIYNMIFYKKDKLECNDTELVQLNSNSKNYILVKTVIHSKVPYSRGRNTSKPKGILKKTNILEMIKGFKDFDKFKKKHFLIDRSIKFPKPKSKKSEDKLEAYLEYCDIITEAYKNKHNEIQKIYNLLYYIVEHKPETPSDDSSITDILKYLDNVVNMEKIKMSKVSYQSKLDEQKKMMKENEALMKQIKNKVNKGVLLY